MIPNSLQVSEEFRFADHWNGSSGFHIAIGQTILWMNEVICEDLHLGLDTILVVTQINRGDVEGSIMQIRMPELIQLFLRP